MSAKKRKRAVEYKETAVFDLFPQIEYTRFQRMRFATFHDYANHLVRIVRYAANFDTPNKICLVYIVGHPDRAKIEKILAETGCSDRVCVLCSDFPLDKLELYHEIDQWRESMKGAGCWSTEADTPSDQWFEDVEQNKQKYSVAPDILQAFVERDSYGLDLLRKYMKLKEECLETFNTFTCYRVEHEPVKISVSHRGHGSVSGDKGNTGLRSAVRDHTDLRIVELYESGKTQREIADSMGVSAVAIHKRIKNMRSRLENTNIHDLESLIQSIYPYGVEAQNINPYAAFAPSAISAALNYVRSGKPDSRLGFIVSERSPPVHEILKLLGSAFENEGFCSIGEMRKLLWSPPFGFRYDGYSAANLSIALSKWIKTRSVFYYDGLSSFYAKDCVGAIVRAVLEPPPRSDKARCLYLESSPHKKVKQFMSALWGVRIEMPGTQMGLHIAQALVKTHRVPLAYVDKRLLKLTLWNVDWWDKEQIKRLAEEVEEHGDEILEAYNRYQYENTHIPDEAQSLMKTDYSWAWSREEYSDILWQTKKYGAWPWDDETHRAIIAEKERRKGEL